MATIDYLELDSDPPPPKRQKIVVENKAMIGARYGYDFVDFITMAIILQASSMMKEDELFSCEISKEDATAGKFDDIVFRYSYNGSRTILKIQVKHRTKNLEVSLQELMETSYTAPFALIKYFKSFHEQYKESNEKQIFVLCTNVKIKKEVEQFVETVYTNDICNVFGMIGAKYYRFCKIGEVDTRKPNCIANALKKDSEFYRLAEMLASHIYGKKELVLYTKNSQRNTLITKYNNAIVRHMIAYSEMQNAFHIKENFIASTDRNTVDFRKQFESAYKEIAVRYKKTTTQDLTAENFDVYGDIAKKGMKTNDRKNLIEQIRNIEQNDIPGNFPADIVTDEEINLFFDKFIIVCDTFSTDELPSKIAQHWRSLKIYEPTDLVCSLETEKKIEGLHRTVSNWMRSSPNLPTILEAKHVEEIIKKVKLHLKYISLKNASNKHIADHLTQSLIAKPKSLRKKPLYKFLAPSNLKTNVTIPDIYTFSTPYNSQFSSMIVLQTYELLFDNRDQIIFIDSNTIEKEKQITLDLCELFVDPLVVVIDCVGYEESKLSDLTKLMVDKKNPLLKIVLIGKHQRNTFCEEFCFLVKEFEASSIETFIKSYGWQILFGTSVPVKVFMHENDDISIIFNFIEDQHKASLNPVLVDDYYENIKDLYVHRRIKYDSNESDEVNKFWIFAELPNTTEGNMIPWNLFYETIQKKCAPNDTDDMERIKAALENRITYELPGGEGDWQEKVHILLGEAGCGKSSYLSWLGWYLQNKDRSSWVIRFNAIDYCTDFERLSSAKGQLTSTEAMRFLYGMIHLALFVRKINQQTILTTDEVRKEAVQCANLLEFDADSKAVVVDEEKRKSSKMTSLQLIMVRLFQEKFNGKNFIVLFDGFDEILPNYKNVASNLLTKIRTFEGVERMYLTSRSYDLKPDIQNIFPGAKFHYFVPFSYTDALTVLHLFIQRNFPQYSSHEIDQQICLLKILMLTIAMQLKSLYAKPIYLRMAMEILRPLIGQCVNFNDQTISTSVMKDLAPKLEKLQLVEQFVNKNLYTSNYEKHGIEFAVDNPGLKSKLDEANEQTIRMHSVLALYVIFDSYERERLRTNDIDALEYMEKIKQGNEKTGIIEAVFDLKPLFIHRTFAEYFAALWLFEHRDRREVKRFLKSASYWSPFRRELREYFDRMLVKKQETESFKCDFFNMATHGRGLEHIKKMLNDNDTILKKTDAGGRTILHLMAIYCYEQNKIENEFFPKILRYWPNLDEKDKLLGWTALDYALLNFNENVALALLKRGATINESEIKETLLACDGKKMWKRALGSKQLILEINSIKSYEREVLSHCLHDDNKMFLIDPDVRSALRKLVFEYGKPTSNRFKQDITVTANLQHADLEGMTTLHYVIVRL